MELETNNNIEKQNDELSRQQLEKLKGQLHSSNASMRRRAAFNLSWMQEDGLEILKCILLGDYSETSKCASAYGLRKMQGRMKKKALDVFKEGLKQRNNTTGEICRNALVLLADKILLKQVVLQIHHILFYIYSKKQSNCHINCNADGIVCSRYQWS